MLHLPLVLVELFSSNTEEDEFNGGVTCSPKNMAVIFDTGSVTNSAVSCQQGVLQYLLIHRAWNGILSSKTDNLPSAFCLCWCALISLPRCFFSPHYPPRLGASNSQCTAGRYFMLERWANRGGGRRAGYLKPRPQNLPRCKRTIFINLHNTRPPAVVTEALTRII